MGVRGSSSEVTSAISSSSADWTHGGRERTARWRSRLSAAVELVPLEDARVSGVLETLWLWLLRAAARSLWSSRSRPETALTLESGRCCDDCDEAVGGGMGEGSRRPPELPGWVELLVWWEAAVLKASWGLRKPSWGPLAALEPLEALEPWSLFLRSAMGLLAIPGELSGASGFEGLPRRTSGSRDWAILSCPSVCLQTRRGGGARWRQLAGSGQLGGASGGGGSSS